MSTGSKGKHGEMLAVQALIAAGYTILEQNWRCVVGEIDIIARQTLSNGNAEVVFIEVRYRADGSDSALESISKRKSDKLTKLAYAYLNDHGLENAAFRIDVAAVSAEGVEFIENAVGW